MGLAPPAGSTARAPRAHLTPAAARPSPSDGEGLCAPRNALSLSKGHLSRLEGLEDGSIPPQPVAATLAAATTPHSPPWHARCPALARHPRSRGVPASAPFARHSLETPQALYVRRRGPVRAPTTRAAHGAKLPKTVRPEPVEGRETPEAAPHRLPHSVTPMNDQLARGVDFPGDEFGPRCLRTRWA
jgi:hypothetical protein